MGRLLSFSAALPLLFLFSVYVVTNVQKNMCEEPDNMRYFLRVRVKKKWSLVRGADSLNESKDREKKLEG